METGAKGQAKNAMNLEEGEIYTLKFRVKTEGSKKIKEVKKWMRLIKCYRHHAQFEDAHGIRRSYGYWELDKLLRGETY